jgi:hypothetical protein
MSSDSPFFDRFGQNERSGMGARSRRRPDLAPPVAGPKAVVAGLGAIDLPPVSHTSTPPPPPPVVNNFVFDANMFGDNALPPLAVFTSTDAARNAVDEALLRSSALPVHRAGGGTSTRGDAPITTGRVSLPTVPKAQLRQPPRAEPIRTRTSKPAVHLARPSGRSVGRSVVSASREAPPRGPVSRNDTGAYDAPEPAPLHDLEFDGEGPAENLWRYGAESTLGGVRLTGVDLDSRGVARGGGFHRTQQLQLTTGDYDHLEALTATEDFMDRFNARSAALRAARAGLALQPQTGLGHTARGPTAGVPKRHGPSVHQRVTSVTRGAATLQRRPSQPCGAGSVSLASAHAVEDESVYAALAPPRKPQATLRAAGEVKSGRQYTEAELDEFVPVCRGCAARLLSIS